MNKLIKKVLVGITAATMMFGSVCTAYAATDSATVAPAPEKQTNVKADYGAKVSTAANGTATVKALPKTTKKSVTVASKVVVDGVSYKVTAIGANVCKNCKKLTSVLIGKNVSVIAAKAFYKKKKLKNIKFKSTKVPKIGKNAFKRISKKAVFKVPKKVRKKYKKKLNKKIGFVKKTMKVK